MSKSTQRTINIDEIFEQQSLEFSVNRERVKSRIDQYKHRNLHTRRQELLSLIDHISLMSYHEYRLLSGTINFIRYGQDTVNWSHVLGLLSLFHEEVKSHERLSVIVDILIKIGTTEVDRVKVKRNFRWFSRPQLLSMTSDEFMHQVIFIMRTFYPLGVNILNPSMIEDDTSVHRLDSSQAIVFDVGSHRKLSLCPDDQSDGFIISLEDAHQERALEPLKLRRGNSALIGRQAISVSSFLGLLVSHRASVDVDVVSGSWSRGALLVVCDQEGQLFLFDRAAKNPFRFKIFADDLVDDYSKGMYTPAFIVSPPSEGCIHTEDGRVSHLLGEIIFED